MAENHDEVGVGQASGLGKPDVGDIGDLLEAEHRLVDLTLCPARRRIVGIAVRFDDVGSGRGDEVDANGAVRKFVGQIDRFSGHRWRCDGGADLVRSHRCVIVGADCEIVGSGLGGGVCDLGQIPIGVVVERHLNAVSIIKCQHRIGQWGARARWVADGECDAISCRQGNADPILVAERINCACDAAANKQGCCRCSATRNVSHNVPYDSRAFVHARSILGHLKGTSVNGTSMGS